MASFRATVRPTLALLVLPDLFLAFFLAYVRPFFRLFVVLSHVRLFVRVCKGIKGRLTVPFWMKFRKDSKRPVTPSPAPPLFPKTVVRFFLDVLKSATKIFGSEMAPSLLLELFQKVIQNGKGKRP